MTLDFQSLNETVKNSKDLSTANAAEQVTAQTKQNGFFSTFIFAWNYWIEYLPIIIIVMVLITVHTFLQVIVPIFTGKLVDIFTNTNTWREAAWICAYIVIFKFLSYLCRQAAHLTWHNLATKIMAKMLIQAFAKIEYLSTEWYANSFAGTTVKKMNRGVWGFDRFGDTIYLVVYPNLLSTLGVMFILFQNSWKIGFFSFLTSLIFLYLTIKFSNKYITPGFEESNQIDNQIGGLISDSITANSLVKSFAAEEYEKERLVNVAEEWRIKNWRVWWYIESLFSIQIFLFILTEAAILGMGIWLWFQGSKTAGDIVTILASAQLAQTQIGSIGNNIRTLQNSMADMGDVVNLDKIDTEIKDAPNATVLKIQESRISFENVVFTYNNQKVPVYQNFSVTIDGDQKVAIVGRSGGGKSTFVKLIQRLYDIQSGRITIDGQDIRSVTKQSLRRAISIVPQEPILFHRSIAENIAYAKPGATLEEIEKSAARAYIDQFIKSLPDGYDTLVGERGIKLSGGERQRLAIARAILADCPILILDEATSNLDSESEILIQKALNDLMVGKTAIIIAHRLSTIKSVDRILVIDQGKIVEEGKHETLLSIPNGYYRAFYSQQFAN